MGLFARKTTTADPYLPELSGKQADKLRQLSIAVLGRLGVTATAAGDHLAVSEGRKFGLFAVARKAAALPEQGWEGMAEEHFGAVVRGAAGGSDVPAAELLNRVYPKIIAPEALAYTQQTDPSRYAYARDAAMMPLLLALDSPESVSYLGAPQIDSAGGADLVWDAALRNLLAAGPGQPEELSIDGGSFLVFETESVYQSSWLAYPDRLMELLGHKAGPLGALLSIPAANILCLHLVTPATGVNDISAILRFTGVMHSQHPSALSPLLYWWEGTTVQPISGHDGERVHLFVPEELASIL